MGGDRMVMGSWVDCSQSVVAWNVAEEGMERPMGASHWRGSHFSNALFLRGQEPCLACPPSISGRTRKKADANIRLFTGKR